MTAENSKLPPLARKSMALLGLLGALTVAGAAGDLLTRRWNTPPAPAVIPAPRTPGDLPHYMSEPGAASRRVDVLARRTRGDFTRLTEMERRWINAMTAGYGHELLRSRARLLGIKPQGPPPRRRPGAE